MPSRGITRCEACIHECDEAFRTVATKLLMLDDGTLQGLQKCEDRERMLKSRLRTVANCALSSSEISLNLEGLMEGRLEINGR